MRHQEVSSQHSPANIRGIILTMDNGTSYDTESCIALNLKGTLARNGLKHFTCKVPVFEIDIC